MDTRWVGAWWFGFVFTAVGFVLVSIPIFGYPKYFPGMMDDLRFTFFSTVFESYPGRWKGGNGRLCTMEPRLRSARFLPSLNYRDPI